MAAKKSSTIGWIRAIGIAVVTCVLAVQILAPSVLCGEIEYPVAKPVGGFVLPSQLAPLTNWMGLILMGSILAGLLVLFAKKPILRGF
jgi:hypothetical protein